MPTASTQPATASPLEDRVSGEGSSALQQEAMQSQEQERIAELERVVGRLTMQLEIAKKASALLSSQPNRNGW